MAQKDQCKDELRLIKNRNKMQEATGWQSRNFCNNCTFYRFILEDDFDAEIGEILPNAFADPKMSVLVQCENCGFKKFDLQEEFQRRADKKPKCIALVKFKAEIFIGKWNLCDDPHPYQSKGIVIKEHPNHAQIICEKDFDVAEGLLDKFEWEIKP